MNWKPIDTAPLSNGRPDNTILCCFRGQMQWVYFVALANGPDTTAPGYAPPDYWCELNPPKNINDDLV